MRIPKKAIGVAFALVATVALAGCETPSPHVIPTSEPSVAPVFKSDAAALAAAKKAYAGYLAASDAVDHDGGSGSDRLADWETPRQFARDSASISRLHSEGHHTTGASSYRNAKLQTSTVGKNGKANVVIYVCLDISQTKLLDSKGNDIGAGRPMVLPLVVNLVGAKSHGKFLLIERSDSWSGTDFCG